jgi:hypothetical protein
LSFVRFSQTSDESSVSILIICYNSKCCSAVRPRRPPSDPFRKPLQRDKSRCNKFWSFFFLRAKFWSFISDSGGSLILSQDDMFKYFKPMRLPIASGWYPIKENTRW